MAASSFIVEGLVQYAVCFGTKAEIEAITPSTEYAIGNASDFGQMNFVRGRGWSTNQPGSPANPFATVQERDAIMPAGVLRRECYILNEFAPLAPGVPGLVKWIDTGTSWILAPDQVLVNLANADGSAFFDEITTLRTPGTAYDLWVSDILPSWLLTSGFRGALAMEASFSDASSTANVTMRARIGDFLHTSTDVANSLSGVSSAGSTFSKGFTMAPVNFRVSGGGIFSVAGSVPFSQGQNAPRPLFDTLVAPRIRLNVIVGSTTNRFRIWSVTIKSGV